MQLTEEQKFIGRRNFLKAVATLPPLAGFAYTATNAGPVKAAIIGTGMEGRVLITNSTPKYMYLIGSYDIRPDNMKLGLDAIKQSGHSPNPKAYESYDQMLEDTEVEAILIASPLKYHGPMAIRALEAGKHVFTEKTMAFEVEECAKAVQIAREKNLNLQVGHQRFYNPLYWDAYRMFAEGLLGNVYHIRGLWHRNTDWNYWIHVNPDLKQELLAMDPTKYGYKDIQQLVNWRWYSPVSRGMWTELASHQLAITNWFFGDEAPIAVQASGGKCKSQLDQDMLPDYTSIGDEAKRAEHRGYTVDDRDVDDHIYAIYEYSNKRTVTYSAIQSNRFDNYYEQIMGTRATIILSNENETYLFWESGWDETKSKKAGQETKVEIAKEDAAGAAFQAHNTGGAATGGGGSASFSPYDPYRWELEGFAHTIRTGAPNLCDGVRGTLAALACIRGQEALASGQKVKIERPAGI
ncbi:MAG: Gfo/Idh/MocA family oxidoreductase [Candidatus Omnitrophota bacterium]